jgi:hypothetical protein
MMYLYMLAADLIEQNSKKLYAVIIEVLVYSFTKKNSMTLKLKDLMNKSPISTTGRPLVLIIY